MKKTAVEWLIKQMVQSTTMKGWIEIFEKAKEMEKQQIESAYKDSTSQFSNDARIDYPKSAEQYYNETFKNK